KESLGVDLVGADAFQGGEGSPENVIPAAELARPLDGGDVARLLDDAEQRGVALRVGADIARVLFGQRVADRAASNRLARFRDGRGQAVRLFPGRPQQVISQPRRALASDTG